jgi:formate dehydrogenase maturation protein FdhE
VAADVAALAAAVGALTTAEREALADALLARDVSHAEAAATRCSLATVILSATNKANTIDQPGQLTVYRTDGVTTHAQIPISTDSHASPIDGVG